MATVDITGKVEQRIMENLATALLSRRKLLVAPLDPQRPDNAERFSDMMRTECLRQEWESRESLQAQMSQKWLIVKDSIEVRFWELAELQYSKVDVAEMTLPKTGNDYHTRTVYIRSLDDAPYPIREELGKYIDALTEHNAFVDSAKKTMKALLNSCKTLNKAVEKYPELTMHVPQQYIDRMAAKVTKSARNIREVAAEEPLDFSGITASAVIHDLTSKVTT